MCRGYEVREALRAQMEVQSKLHLQVEVIFLLSVVPFSFVNVAMITKRGQCI